MDPCDRLCDDEALYMIHQMDEFSLNMLFGKYQKVAISLIRYQLVLSNDMQYEDDLIFACLEPLYEAMYQYRQDLNCAFGTYVRRVLGHVISNFYRHMRCQHGRAQYHLYSLDHYVNNDSSTCLPAMINHDLSMEGISILYVEQAKELLREVLETLFPWEQSVILLRLQGYRYAEIAKAVKIEERQVEYVLTKIRNGKL